MPKPAKLSSDELAFRLIDSPNLNFRLNFVWNKTEKIFYVFDEKENYYKILDVDDDLSKIIFQTLIEMKSTPKDPIPYTQDLTPNLVSNIIKILTWQCPRSIDLLSDNFVTFSDGKMMDLDTFSIHPVVRDKISLLKFPFPSSILEDPAVLCPNWLSFLNDILITKESSEFDNPIPDASLLSLIQEMFGCALFSHSRYESTFFLYGNGQNGKSKLLSVLKTLFPKDLISCSTLEQLTTNRFKTASLVGKRLNVTSEEDSKFLASDVFKRIVSGEEISGERKFQKDFSFVPTCKMIFATNKIPTFDSIDYAIRRRIFIIPFFRKIPEAKKQINIFEEKLLPELPGIFKWALEGSKRLAQNEKFTHSDAVEKMRDTYERIQSSAVEFIQENFVITGNYDDIFQKARLFEGYKAWVEADAGRKPLGKMKFYDELENRYARQGLQFPDQVVRHPLSHDPMRAVRGVKPTEDQTAWIHATNWLNGTFPV